MKILAMPEQFNSNEWCLILSMIAVFAYIFWLPRRFPHTLTIVIVLFSLSLEKAADLILEYPPYSLYYLNDKPEYELFDLITCFLYPASGYLFLYYYDKWNIRNFKNFYYIVGWSIFAVLFEWITVITGVFVYQGWTLFYSFPVYLITICLYTWFFHYSKSILAKTNPI
jgi:hypothetical protein